MPRGRDLIKGVFVRPVDQTAMPAAELGLPANVIPLRAAHSTHPTHSTQVHLPLKPGAPPRTDDHVTRPSGRSAAPEVVVIGMDGGTDLWFALALARALRRRLQLGTSFVADPALDEECGEGEARLKVGAARMLLPFAARRHGADTMRIGALAAKRHGDFLRALGPLVWSFAGIDRERDELKARAGNADGIVLTRPSAVEAAYAALLADELRGAGAGAPVVRVLVGPRLDEDGEVAVAGGDDLLVPAGAFDRFRAERGLGCSARTARAIDMLAEELCR